MSVQVCSGPSFRHDAGCCFDLKRRLGMPSPSPKASDYPRVLKMVVDGKNLDTSNMIRNIPNLGMADVEHRYFEVHCAAFGSCLPISIGIAAVVVASLADASLDNTTRRGQQRRGQSEISSPVPFAGKGILERKHSATATGTWSARNCALATIRARTRATRCCKLPLPRSTQSGVQSHLPLSPCETEPRSTRKPKMKMKPISPHGRRYSLAWRDRE